MRRGWIVVVLLNVLHFALLAVSQAGRDAYEVAVAAAVASAALLPIVLRSMRGKVDREFDARHGLNS